MSGHAPKGDDAIRQTNDDATISRLSAANLGYFHDPFVKYFVRRPSSNERRRSPLMNWGTYLRVTGLDELVDRFLGISVADEQDPSSSNAIETAKQILVLGAGSDTRWWRLKERGKQPAQYFEIDFPEITSLKIASIKKNEQLSRSLGTIDISSGGAELHSQAFHILPGDLRTFHPSITDALVKSGFNKDIPTLILSECVLVYLDPSRGDSIISWCSENLRRAVFVTYEQILPDDVFGRMMLRNLQSRGVDLRGIKEYPDLASQVARYISLGWDESFSVNLNDFYNSSVSSSEKKRLTAIEALDELEEWRMLLQHYCFVWAWLDRSKSGFTFRSFKQL
ncbi:leucine carboxyl methyltransferase 1-like protein [Gonapodya prolifera JEL478]|uniref:Leucine carboxyl methyltransferase 1 n=1 Tax=Gonapodya prolifera (strain JEL478) TaxID=1344416 RepID=A0A139A5M9_GONPJ|nr:leucine carboxyl methyltransferase 1-like protein [Gonapodya prolifera JEL478]|eukprot:KXS12054.1 leucine carboxyl methyltransferase 1-like protein [Gonapodya prolifera JEL478]